MSADDTLPRRTCLLLMVSPRRSTRSDVVFTYSGLSSTLMSTIPVDPHAVATVEANKTKEAVVDIGLHKEIEPKSIANSENELLDFPDGGLRAWMVVCGVCFRMNGRYL